MLALYQHAQDKTIKGFCIDVKGKPIENVFIKINTKPVQNAYSDNDGMYMFNVIVGDSIQLVYQANEIIKKKKITKLEKVKVGENKEIKQMFDTSLVHNIFDYTYKELRKILSKHFPIEKLEIV